MDHPHDDQDIGVILGWRRFAGMGGAPPFGSPLKLSRVHWVRPEVVVEVAYLTWTEGGPF